MGNEPFFNFSVSTWLTWTRNQRDLKVSSEIYWMKKRKSVLTSELYKTRGEGGVETIGLVSSKHGLGGQLLASMWSSINDGNGVSSSLSNLRVAYL